MKPSEAIAIYREKIRRIIANFGGTNPRIFGSVARGEDTDGSDLDLLVDDPDGRLLDLLALGGMNYEISGLLGISVDIVPSRTCRRKSVMRRYGRRRPYEQGFSQFGLFRAYRGSYLANLNGLPWALISPNFLETRICRRSSSATLK